MYYVGFGYFLQFLSTEKFFNQFGYYYFLPNYLVVCIRFCIFATDNI